MLGSITLYSPFVFVSTRAIQGSDPRLHESVTPSDLRMSPQSCGGNHCERKMINYFLTDCEVFSAAAGTPS